MTAHAEPFRGSSRFRVLGHIGQGASGSVYEVLDRESSSRVALKILRHPNPEALLLLKTEFRAVQALSHPNIVTPKELIEENGQWFFTMDFVDGTDFLSYARAPTLDEARLRAVLRQLVEGLSALHADHKVHRDIKPSNVLVTTDGRVRILDFGVAVDVTPGAASWGDEDGLIVGTVSYMAPEQVTGERVSPAADWYAVGVMLYEALTGRLPIVGTAHDVLVAKMATEPPPPRSLEPSIPADLDQLTIELLRIEPAKRPEGFEILQRLGIARAADAACAPPFVGRGAELAKIEADLERVAEGHAVTVLVEGESGIGKSLLVREFTRRAEAGASALVFRGRCYERESVPYKGLDSIIDDLARFLATLEEEEAQRLLPVEAAALCRLFPVLETVVSRRAPVTGFEVKSPQEARARMFAVLRALFTNVARHRRLVLIIDDLQWVDADSLALLAELLRPPDAPPLLLVASIRSGRTTSRSPAIHARLRELPGEVRQMHLDPLPEGDARELIRRLLSDAPGAADAGDIDAISAEAKGHPLFIEELVRHRSVQRGEAHVRLDDALFERASRLPPAARRLLEAVAVAGVPVQQQVLARAAALDFAELFDPLGALRAAHFARTSGAYRHDTVEPYHDRVRESVLQHLDPSVRRDWHARLALALERSGEADPEKLVTHWVGAGETARAAECALRAAGEAATALAFEHAAALYRTAIELGVHEKETLTDIKGKLAEALANCGRDAEAAAVHLELAAAAATSWGAIELRRRAAEQLLRSGQFEQGVELLGSVLAAVGLAFPRAPLVVLVCLLFFRLKLGLRSLSFDERDPAGLPPRTLMRIDTLRSAGQGLSMQDNLTGAYFQTRSLLMALDAGDPVRLIRALSFEACFTAVGGTRTRRRTEELVASTRALAGRLGTPEAIALARTAEGFAHFFRGEWPAAKQLLTESEALFRDGCLGVVWELGSLRTVLYRALGYTGELRELAARLGPVFREVERRGDRHASILLRTTARALTGLDADEPERVERELREAREWLGSSRFLVQHYYCFTAETQLDLYRGDGASAHERTLRIWPALRRSMLLRMQQARSFAISCRVRTALALVAAEPARRARLWRDAERDLERMLESRHPWADADVTLLRASVAAQRGERDQARAGLDAASRAFDDLGMRLHAAGARRRLGELLGGSEGEELVRTADGAMHREDVRDPARFSRVIAPEHLAGR